MLPIQKRLSNFFYGILSLPSTALGFALSVQISALSWLLSTKYELAIDEIGLVWAAGPVAGIFGQVIFGVLSDRVWFWGGRRRPPAAERTRGPRCGAPAFWRRGIARRCRC